MNWPGRFWCGLGTMPKRVSMTALRERALRDDAAKEASDLFARHGADAIDILSERLIDQSRSAEQRRADRLTIWAVEKMDRAHRRGGTFEMVMAWESSMPVATGFAGLFGFGARRPRP
jgi:hypothetical protein